MADASAVSDARVVVLVRDGCHLCEDAVAVIEAVCVELGVRWSSRDVDADPQLRAAWTDHVPVTFVDGREHARWFVEAERLRAVLAD